MSINGQNFTKLTAKALAADTGEAPITEIDHAIARREVPEEVTKAPIEVYADDVLTARLNHYEREALLERNPGIRAAMKGEAARTKNEITRRRAGLVAAAERVFK